MAALVRSGARAPATLREQLAAFVQLGRPRTCVPGLICYALGHSYTGYGFSWRVVVGAFLALMIGFAANAHNAYTDIEEDSRNLPGRVYLIAKLGHRQFQRILGLLRLAMVALAVALTPHFLLLMLLAVWGLHQYSFPPLRAKGRPILGLWVFAQAVVFPFLFGWATEPDDMFAEGLPWFFAALMGHVFPTSEALVRGHRYFAMLNFLTLWFMAKGTIKNIPDFHGDLAAGLRTSATLCGSWRTAVAVASLATLGAYLCLVPLVVFGFERSRLLLALLWVVPVLGNCRRLRVEDRPRANDCLKRDMLISSGFIATVLVLVAPGLQSVAFIFVGGIVLYASDRWQVDSRRRQDVAQEAA
jgi:4-hydroxybenzoate polyprenyltransferase